MKVKIIGAGATVLVAAVCAGTWFWLNVQAPEARVKNAVRHTLTDPQSATFDSLRAINADGLRWCGRVNAKNRMGGMVGFTTFMVELLPVSEFKLGIVNREIDEITAKVNILNASNVTKFLASDGTACQAISP